MIRGEEVRVCRPAKGAADPFGKPSESYDWESAETVPNVLIAPGATSDLDETRPDGVEVAYSLYFPKEYGRSLKGCRVDVYGERFDVVGDPRRYPPHLTPGEWNAVAEVARTDG